MTERDIDDLRLRMDQKAALALFVALTAAYVLFLPPAWAAWFVTDVSEPVFLGVLLLLMIRAASVSRGPNARLFFALLAFGFSVWFLIWPISILFFANASIQGAVVADTMYLVFFATIGATIELRLDTRTDERWLPRRVSAAVGVVLLVFAVFGYFAIIPVALTDSSYATLLWLHICFDGLIGMRFITISLQTPSRAWRRLYSLLGVAFLLLAAADALSLYYRQHGLVMGDLRLLNAIWYLWYPVAYVATGINPYGLEKSLDDERPPPRYPTTNPLLLIGLSMPLIHFIGYASGWLATDARDLRETFSSAWLLTVALALFVLNRFIRGRLKALDAQVLAAQTKADQLEEQLGRELRIRSLGRLASGLAHDFGNTITALHLHTVAAERKVASGDVAEMEFAGANKSIQYAKKIVEQLKLFGAAGERVKTEPLDLNAEVASTLELVRPSLNGAMSLEFEACADKIRVEAQSSMLHQVVANYIHNAIDAIESAGSIVVTTDVQTVSGRCRSCGEEISGAHAVLKVSDSGPGVGDDLMDSVFEPLVTTKPVGLGSGLGLSSVHGIMHKLGGHVGLVNGPSGGACFIAYFPLARGTDR